MTDNPMKRATKFDRAVERITTKAIEDSIAEIEQALTLRFGEPIVSDGRTDFAWLIEAPGARYLGTREIAHYPEFFWTTDHEQATRFYSEAQADGVMMAVRRMAPDLFAFAKTLGDARPIEHGWIGQ